MSIKATHPSNPFRSEAALTRAMGLHVRCFASGRFDDILSCYQTPFPVYTEDDFLVASTPLDLKRMLKGFHAQAMSEGLEFLEGEIVDAAQVDDMSMVTTNLTFRFQSGRFHDVTTQRFIRNTKGRMQVEMLETRNFPFKEALKAATLIGG